ncbi:MAG: competence/damage-inducible protein A [Bacteroidota bacterium]|nr:competence/damage-inducible protein A [Bacteroidota bacterium]
MKAIIISIGDEILIGQVLNTNAAFISEKLNSVGIEATRILTVGDDEDEILNAFKENYSRYDIIMVTGGLGPTHDDLTRSAVCKFFDLKLISSDEVRKNVEEFLKKHNRKWSDAAENQTLFPAGAKVIPNKYGTAAGEFIEKDNKYFIVMPGVPYEMESMMNDFVVPFFAKKKIDRHILHRTLMTTGIAESELAARLGNLDNVLKGAKLAFLPSPIGVRLRISVSGSEKDKCETKLFLIEKRIHDKIGKYIYGIDDEELEAVIGKLLTDRNIKIAIAESCTGGLIADKITNVPGSSKYLERTVVTYSNQSKIDLLHVPNKLIDMCGAVSKEVAEAMALGIRQNAGTDIGISTTGVAGPAGGSQEKPVGLVWIGYSDANETIALKFNFGEGRRRIKDRASQAALDLIRRKLLNIE